MKKLFLVLALLIFMTHGAFATCNADTDKFDTKGWCIDLYGTLTPKAIDAVANGSGTAATQGGVQVPVINMTAAYSTYDSLLAYQSGSSIVDFGGATAPTLTGAGTEYILPAAAQGLTYTFTVASNSTITVDCLTTADTIYFASGTAGYGIKNSSKASGDSITLIGSTTGKWVVDVGNGTWITTGAARVH